jgi:hypothetical protein
LSGIIGFALYVSTAKSGTNQVKLESWQVIRLFLMPFCVSSFSALVKGRGFVLIFSPIAAEVLAGAGLCGALCVVVFLLRRGRREAAGI